MYEKTKDCLQFTRPGSHPGIAKNYKLAYKKLL